MHFTLWALAAATPAHTVQGYIENFEISDIATTEVEVCGNGRKSLEPLSSRGNFTFLDLPHGKYELRLWSTTLFDPSVYSLVLDDHGVEARRAGPRAGPQAGPTGSPVGYPICIAAERKAAPRAAPKPRLYELYTDPAVLAAFGALMLLHWLPQAWRDISAEDLKVLEGQEGLASAFETAQKIAARQ